MAAQTHNNSNWLNRLRTYMNLATDHRREVEQSQQADSTSDDEVRTALRKEMAKQVMDTRMRNLVYNTMV